MNLKYLAFPSPGDNDGNQDQEAPDREAVKDSSDSAQCVRAMACLVLVGELGSYLPPSNVTTEAAVSRRLKSVVVLLSGSVSRRLNKDTLDLDLSR